MRIDRKLWAIPIAMALATCPTIPTQEPSPTPNRLPPVNVPVASPTPEEPFDYCKQESSSEVKSPPSEEILFERNTELLDSWEVTEQDFVGYKGSKDKYQVALVPVGYDDEEFEQKMQQIIENLKDVYGNVNIEFTYVNKNADMGIKYDGSRATLIDNSDDNVILTELNKVHPINTAMYIFNSDKYLGSGGYPPMLSGNNEFSASFLAPRNLLHHFLLTTRRKGNLGPEGILDNTEIFTSTDHLRDFVQTSFDKLHPKPEPINGTCGNDQLYTFYNGPNLLGDKKFTGEEITTMLHARIPILNPMQIDIINTFIDKSFQPFDFCPVEKETTDSGNTSEQAPLPPPEFIFEPNPDALANWTVNAENFHDYQGVAYEVTLVPVGYGSKEEIKETMEKLIADLKVSYQGVYVTFSYIDSNAPVGIEKNNQYATLHTSEDYQKVLNELNKIQRVNNAMFIINSDFTSAAWEGGLTTISGNNGRTSYEAAHEEAHVLGLSDGYQATRRMEDFQGLTELFTSTETLLPEALDAYISLGSEASVINTHDVCGPWDVYRFYGDRSNLMIDTWTSKEFRRAKRDGTPLFNPIQIEIMNRHIGNVIKVFG